VRKTQEGELNCVSFFFFLNEVQCSESARVQSLTQRISREREREREEKDTKQLYRFLPQSRSIPVPLALPRRVH